MDSCDDAASVESSFESRFDTPISLDRLAGIFDDDMSDAVSADNRLDTSGESSDDVRVDADDDVTYDGRSLEN